jgi:ribosome-associated translation inhibitor RaiA
MPFFDESHNLRIELDQQGCELSAVQIGQMESTLDTLRKTVETFPVSNLHITVVYHHASQDYHVKTSLSLTGKTLFTGDRDNEVPPAFARCMRKLAHKVTAYKARMNEDSEIAKQVEGTHQLVTPSDVLDLPAIEAAIDGQDYFRFRRCFEKFEGSLRRRVGRWLQRYPQIETQLGSEFEIDDIIEEVLLNAFEKFPLRSHDVPPGQWLDHLIDPSVQALLLSPDEEFANVSFARSMQKIET